MSFGRALDWPSSPATAQWAFYPTTAQVTDKLNALTPVWKRPAWWWTRRFGGWPFSAEGLAGIFDYNQAPFFQSSWWCASSPRRAVCGCGRWVCTAG